MLTLRTEFIGAATVAERELVRFWRDRARIMTSMIQPLMFLFVFGTGLSTTMARGNFGVDFRQFMYPGIVCMSIMGVAFFSTISTVWDREFGFLKEILVAPVSRTSIALGKLCGAAVIASIQGVILFALAPVVGVKLHFAEMPALLGVMLLIALAIAGLGLFVASVVKTIENHGIIMNLLVFPMFFMSGAFFPLTAVPKWLGLLASLDPLSYGVDAMRQIMLDGQVDQAALGHLVLRAPTADALILVGFAVAFLSAAVYSFERRN